MELKKINNIHQFKQKILLKYYEITKIDIQLNIFFKEILLQGDVYIIGGFLRDIANDINESKDIDIVFNPKIDIQKTLSEINVSFKRNIFGGYKIKFETCTIDIWSFDENWAFKKKLVKQNDEYMMRSISNGTFFNYDSLVFNLNKLKSDVKNYNKCVEQKKLDILQKNIFYKKYNPSIEGNTLKAIYLCSMFDLEISENTRHYLAENFTYITNRYGNIDNVISSANGLGRYKDLITTSSIRNFMIKTKLFGENQLLLNL